LKILVVCQYYYPENISITAITKQLVVLGHDVTVLTGQPNYGYGKILPEYRKIRFEIIDGVKVHRVKILPRRESRFSLISNYLSFYLSANWWVVKHKDDYDIVFSMSLSPVISVVPAINFARKKNIKHVLYCVDIWPESVAVSGNIKHESILYKILNIWSKRIYRAVDRIIVGSPSYQQYLSTTHNIDNKKIKTVIQPAIVSENTKEPIVYGKGFNIVYSGNLGKIQLLDELLKAMADNPLPEVYFHIIGFGTETRNFTQNINEYKLQKRVFVYGGMASEQAARYFVNADALYLSLKSEGYVGKTIPNKLVMYLAFKKPILAAITGDAADILKKTEGAIIIGQSSQDIAEGIKKISNLSQEKLLQMASNNYAYYNQHLTNEKISKEIEDYLIEVNNS
jgi:glycosyltransferase involved in cell wall biosynthesis